MGARSGCGGTGQPLLEVGRVARPHGLLGEVVVALLTNLDERIAPGAELTGRLASGLKVASPGTPGSPASPADHRKPAVRVLKVRKSRPFQGRWLVEFEGVHSREAADELRGAVLVAPALDDPEAFFVHDLVGREVVQLDGTRRGNVLAVQANPASDLLVLEDGNLVPLRFVVGREPGRLIVDVPEGLFE